jgi:hypothetical protein
MEQHFFKFSLSTGPPGGGWTQTLDLGMVRRVLYHCATATDSYNQCLGRCNVFLIVLLINEIPTLFLTVVLISDNKKRQNILDLFG